MVVLNSAFHRGLTNHSTSEGRKGRRSRYRGKGCENLVLNCFESKPRSLHGPHNHPVLLICIFCTLPIRVLQTRWGTLQTCCFILVSMTRETAGLTANGTQHLPLPVESLQCSKLSQGSRRTQGGKESEDRRELLAQLAAPRTPSVERVWRAVIGVYSARRQVDEDTLENYNAEQR